MTSDGIRARDIWNARGGGDVLVSARPVGHGSALRFGRPASRRFRECWGGDNPDGAGWSDPRLTEDPRNFVFDPPDEPGGIPYAELSADEQAAVDRTGELAETGQGYAVQQSWSRAAESARQRARLRKAKNESGLDDADVLGVK